MEPSQFKLEKKRPIVSTFLLNIPKVKCRYCHKPQPIELNCKAWSVSRGRGRPRYLKIRTETVIVCDECKGKQCFYISPMNSRVSMKKLTDNVVTILKEKHNINVKNLLYN